MMMQAETSEFLRKARNRFESGKQLDAVDRAVAEDDTKFAYADDKDLDQWEENAKVLRANRPIQQWNRIPTYVQQVVNDGRQNKPAIKISPEDDTPPETAEYFQGRIRHIEYESDADTAKDCAREQQVVSGRGFMRVKTEWIPGTQRQRLCIEPIENQFSVVWDPSAWKYTRCDADYCFVISYISKDEYVRDYGQEAYDARMEFAKTGDPAPTWIGVGGEGEKIQIAEYWLKEYSIQAVPANGAQPERQENVASVCSYVIDGAQILKTQPWIGSTIPIIPMWGKVAVVKGQTRTFSLIRNAKTPQRGANLLVSNMFELIGQMPKVPYLVPLGGIAANHEQVWANALNAPVQYLYYLQWDAAGHKLDKPERITQEPPIQACLEALNVCFDGIKAAMGIFDAAIGAKSNETSGIAIQRRQKESDVANYHFPDNEARSNKYLGEILVELIPLVDRAGGSYQTRTEDGKTHSVPIGVEHQDWKTGKVVTHDLMSAQVGVAVSTGPTYQAARQEEEDRDIALVTANPELMWSIGPSMLRKDDSPGSEERAVSLERYIAAKFPNMPPKPQQGQEQVAQQQLQDAQKQLQAMGQELQTTKAFSQQLHEQIQTKQHELDNAVRLKSMDVQSKQEDRQADLEMKKYTVDQQELTKRTLGLAAIDATDALTQLKEELGTLKGQHQRLHEQVIQQQDHAHEAAQAELDRQHAAGMASQSHVAQAEQQASAQDHATGLQESAQEAAQQQPEPTAEPSGE